MDLEQLSRQFNVGVDEMKAALQGDKEKLAKLDQDLAEFGARLTEIEQKSARRAGPAHGDPPKTWGRIVAESDKLKAFAAARTRGKVNIEVKTLTSAANSAGALVAPDRQADVTLLPRRPMTIRDLLNAQPTTSGSIEYQRQTLRNINADIVTEGTLKPESQFEFEDAEAKVVTIAHWTKASKQVLADAPQLMSIIDGELRYGLMDVEERKLLYGDGSPGQLEGMVTAATSYSAPFALTGGTMIDRLRLSMLQARLALYPATGFILNPSDWAHIELTKDGEGRYILGNPKDGAQPRLWGLPVVESDAMTVDKFLTGAFGLAAQLFDREDAEVLVSTEDGDNFRYNLVTILAEERVALVIRRPEALVYGDFGNV